MCWNWGFVDPNKAGHNFENMKFCTSLKSRNSHSNASTGGLIWGLNKISLNRISIRVAKLIYEAFISLGERGASGLLWTFCSQDGVIDALAAWRVCSSVAFARRKLLIGTREIVQADNSNEWAEACFGSSAWHHVKKKRDGRKGKNQLL